MTERFPAHERYGLTSQARRAAFSAAANIAEGSAKRGHREFRRFLDISNGSLAELAYIFLLARDLGLIDDGQYSAVNRLVKRASALTWRLYRSVSRAKP